MALNFGRIALATAIILGTGLSAGSVMAQGKRAIAQACRDDLAKFCADVKPGGGRLKPCVKEHFRSFSPTCQAALRDVVAEKKQSQ